jgi:hypothetical protein
MQVPATKGLINQFAGASAKGFKSSYHVSVSKKPIVPFDRLEIPNYSTLLTNSVLTLKNIAMTTILNLRNLGAGFLLAATLSSAAMAATTPTGVSERAKKTFVKTFPKAESINWTESKSGDLYTAYFWLYDVKTVANFDQDGQLISVLRYYGEDRLPLTVLTLVKNKYSDKTISGVTEFSKNGNEDVAYYIKLEDAAHWYTVKVVGNDMEQTEKLDKQ